MYVCVSVAFVRRRFVWKRVIAHLVKLYRNTLIRKKRKWVVLLMISRVTKMCAFVERNYSQPALQWDDSWREIVKSLCQRLRLASTLELVKYVDCSCARGVALSDMGA